MGTNYEYGTSDGGLLHVGKKSAGWTFHFRGYRGGHRELVSLADWADLFRTTNGVLTDEYGRTIEDPLQFLAELERPTLEQQESEDSPARRGSWSPRPDPATEWRDPEGFAFYDGEFS